jgi:hypothetical protein
LLVELRWGGNGKVKDVGGVYRWEKPALEATSLETLIIPNPTLIPVCIDGTPYIKGPRGKL